MEAGELNNAIGDLRTLRQSDPQLFTANNYDYLLARLSERAGDAATSAANYETVAARNSVLSEYALWHLSQMARSMGDLVLERERLRRLVALKPRSLVRDAATLRLGQSFFESKDFSGAVAALLPLAEAKNAATAREALSLIAQAYQQLGKQQEALATFTKLVMQMPDASRPDDFALEAVRALDTLARNDLTGGQPPLSEGERLLRASVYQFNRDFEGARAHYLGVAAANQQSPAVPNALYQVARGYYLQQNYEEALKYFQQVADQTSDKTSARDALLSIAASYSRLKRTSEAIAAYKLFIERFPDAPNPERPYLNIIDALHEAGRFTEALTWVQQTRARFKDQFGAAVALFSQLRIHLAQASWSQVVSDSDELRGFSDLGGSRIPGGATQAEVIFLQSYAFEQLGKVNDAINGYLAVADGRNEYYGQRATQHLQALALDVKTRGLVQSRLEGLLTATKSVGEQPEQTRRLAQDALRLAISPATRSELIAIVRRAYESLPAYSLPTFKALRLGRQELVTTADEGQQDEIHRAMADELLFLGLYDEGAAEFAAAEHSKPTKTTPLVADLDYTLAVYFLRGGMANRAVRFAEQVWRKVPSDYVLELAPRELVELLYPAPFRQALLRHAPPRGVDPRFVLSIARQESRFQADAKSIAAARGLMQFIPSTANEVAGKLGRSNFRQDELYNADTAILFGSQYLATLSGQFPQMPQAVAASYNGGADNMERWVGRSRSRDPDRYVSEIGFSQTKDYVFKVMSNFWIYQKLYDAQLVPL